MTIGSRQNLTKAKFMNLKMDNRPIEHKPSNKLLGVHSGAPRAHEARAWEEPHSLVNLPIPENVVIT